MNGTESMGLRLNEIQIRIIIQYFSGFFLCRCLAIQHFLNKAELNGIDADRAILILDDEKWS
ncbi:MAG: hypothetical protein V3U46_02685, partial [Acidimicrobiia bacterium]